MEAFRKHLCIIGLCLLALSCSKSEGKPAKASKPEPLAGKTLTVGFVYVGPRDDYGYNQAHSEGAKEIAKLPGIKVLEEEKVAETSDVQKTMESMINMDGAS